MVADYVALTKPKVQSLLLLTTVTTMLVAGDPSIGLDPADAASAATCPPAARARSTTSYDRDIDAQMARTADRPVPAGRDRARARRCAFGIALAALSFVELSLTSSTCWPRCCRSRASSATRCVYTIWLKRRTPQNIVIGGAAGAVPPLVGWAAVDRHGRPARAIYLFAIVFFWTPPHFWALSLLMKDEYAKVGVPMLPVVRGEAETRRQILLYTRAALRRDAAAVLRRRRSARSTSSPRSCSAARFIGGAVAAAAPRRPPHRAACSTSSRSPTSRCCSCAMVADAKL